MDIEQNRRETEMESDMIVRAAATSKVDLPIGPYATCLSLHIDSSAKTKCDKDRSRQGQGQGQGQTLRSSCLDLKLLRPRVSARTNPHISPGKPEEWR